MWPIVFNHQHSSTGNTTRRHHRRDGESTDSVMLDVAQRHAPQQKDGFIDMSCCETPPVLFFHLWVKTQRRGTNAGQNRTCTVGEKGM